MSGPAPRLSVLEIFLLFCAKIGLGTVYQIMSQTGVGAGATTNQLKDLEHRGLVTSSPGPRRQVFFTLTEAGELLLEEALERNPIDWISAARSTYDGLPRVIFFSWLRGRLDEAHAAIDRTESRFGRKAEDADREAERCRKILIPPKGAPSQKFASPEYLTAGYRLIVALASSADAKRKLDALGALRQLIDELPPAPKTFLNGAAAYHEGGTQESGPAMPTQK